ncbi:hypothetical protein [Streptomyces yangpuensis]|uniref:hypothetical protein n=1 Tax=Streptomyces yangpuensis TaxID=1648182 RepID=UPI0036A61D60
MPGAALVAAISFWIVNLAFGWRCRPLLGVRGSSPGWCGITMPAAALVAAISFWIVNLAFG